MKTIKSQLGAIAICMVILFSINSQAQNKTKMYNSFIRVYSESGKKIAKGKIVFVNDSALGLTNGHKLVKLAVSDIGHIKTKRSVGNSVLTTSLISGAAGAMIGLVTSNEETKTGDGGWLFGEYEYTTGVSPATGAAIGGGIGLAGGALIGLGSSLFKNSETYIINGDLEKWKFFKEVVEKVKPK